MKRILIYLCALALLAACSMDKGNYDYRELDELEITGVESGISVMLHEKLELAPDLGEKAKADEEYLYEWKVISMASGNEVTVIGKEKILDYEVLLASGAYRLIYTVTDRTTGLFWQVESALEVSSTTSEGWMVLCSDEGRARLDMYSAAMEKVYQDVLKGNGMPELQGPRRIQWLPDKTDAGSPYYLLTDEGATRLGKASFSWKPEYDFRYECAADKVIPWSITTAGFGKMVVGGTKAYYSESMGIDGLYGSAVNKDFEVAPQIGTNVLAEQNYAAMYMMYDLSGKRFMAYCPMLAYGELGAQEPLATMEDMEAIARGLHPEDGVVGTAFRTYPEGLDYVYMENTRYDSGNGMMGTTYTILAEGDRRYVYGIQLGDMLLFKDCTFVLGRDYYGDISACESITSPEALFAFSSLKRYLYYAVGDKVWRADLAADPVTSKVQFTLPGEEITCLKFNLYRNRDNQVKSYDLLVGSRKGSRGTLRIYEGYEHDGDFSAVAPQVISGFAPIVDVEYKEKINQL